jgi:hypothetical protein
LLYQILSTWELENFTPEEVACNHCHVSFMDFEFMKKIQGARYSLGRAIYGNSWCRCTFHNLREGGRADSSHRFDTDLALASRAGDLTVHPPKLRIPLKPAERGALEAALRAEGLNRFGHHDFFIHVDDDPRKPPFCTWLY